MFNAVILNPHRVVFEGRVKKAFLPGDLGEFEILDFHRPIISLLKEGEIILDTRVVFSIRGGIVKFNNNELMALVEE